MMKTYSEELETMQKWFCRTALCEILRLHTPAQVVEQRGTIDVEYTIARDTAAGFLCPPA